MKHLPEDSIKKLEKTMPYNNMPVYLNKTSIDRRIHNGSGSTTNAGKANDAKDLNIDDRITKFQDQLRDGYVYRIPLTYFTDLGKINFLVKTDFRIRCHLETEMKRLFQSRKVLASTATVPAPDAKIIFTKAPFIQYEQILHDEHFKQYLETIMVSKKILRIGAQKIPTQKTYEINVGQDSLYIDFLGLQRKFDWLELSIVYHKSHKHTTIYDSYNIELTAKSIKSVKLSNFAEIYSLTNERKYDIDNLTQKHLLQKQFVAWNCNGCSTAPLTYYINNPIYQELIGENGFFGPKSDERIYLDLRASSGYTNEAEKLERNDSKINLHVLLKSAVTKKLRLRVWDHSIGEYLYILARSGLTLGHRTYAFNPEDEEFLEWEEDNL